MIRRFLPCLVAGFLMLGSPAAAALFSVTSGATDDLPDLDAVSGIFDGVCNAGGGVCTLRAAVQEANATVDPDTILVPAGIFVLSRTGGGEDLADTGDLDLLEAVELTGAGVGQTIIDGNGSDRIFDVVGIVSVSLEQMTLRNGAAVTSATAYIGGAILIAPLSSLDLIACEILDSRANAGGGLFSGNGSVVSITNTTFRGNRALDLGDTNPWGGAIFSQSDLDLEYSTLSGNSAATIAGGIYSDNATALSVRNSTISGNTTDGIRSTNTPVDLVNATVYGNTGTGLQFYSFNGSHSLSIKNSILAGNGSGDCWFTGTAGPQDIEGEHNLDSDGTCPLNESLGDFSADDPLLDALLLNGGTTATHVPRQGSPVIDNGDNATCETDDQRGVARPPGGSSADVGSDCDIGAVEVLTCTGTDDLLLTDPPTATEYEACFTITAHTDFKITSGTVTLRSRDAVILGDGFRVGAGAGLVVVRDPAAGSGVTLP